MNDAERIDAQSSSAMRRLQAGDNGAMAELISLWQEVLLRFVFRYLQSETEAREVVHETFVRVHSQRAKYLGDRSFRSWVLTLAANLARNRRRWWRRNPSAAWLKSVDQQAAVEQLSPAPSPAGAVIQNERVAAVRAALEKLPHDLRVTLLLYEYEELGYREIAHVLGCSERGVEKRLARARERLRGMLSEFLRESGRPAAPGVRTSSVMVGL